MITKKVFLLLMGIWLVSLVNAQKTDLNVLTTSGQTALSDDVVISWTLGEAFVKTLEPSHGMITEGFQQPFLCIDMLNTFEEMETLDFILYPNPTMNSVVLSTINDMPPPITITLFDRQGKAIKSTVVKEPIRHHRIEMYEYEAGFYILRVESLDRKQSKSFTITKIH